MLTNEERARLGQAARADSQALAAASDLLLSDLGRAYTHQAVAAHELTSLTDDAAVEFTSASLDRAALVLSSGVSTVVPMTYASELALAGFDIEQLGEHISDRTEGAAWFDEPADVMCDCEVRHPPVVGIVWQGMTEPDGDVLLAVFVVCSTEGTAGEDELPTYVVDTVLTLNEESMRHAGDADVAAGSIPWSVGIARWAIAFGANPAVAEAGMSG